MYLGRLQILLSACTILPCIAVFFETVGSLRDTTEAGDTARLMFVFAIITAIVCLTDIAISASLLLFDNLSYNTRSALAFISYILRYSFGCGMLALASVIGSVAYWLIQALLMVNSFLRACQFIMEKVEEVRAKRNSGNVANYDNYKSTPGEVRALHVTENILLALSGVFLLFSLSVGFKVCSNATKDLVAGSELGCAVFASMYNLANIGIIRFLKDPISQNPDLRRTRLSLNYESIMRPLMGTTGLGTLGLLLGGRIRNEATTYWAFLILFTTSLVLQVLRLIVENLKYMKNNGNVTGTDQGRYELVSGEQH